jgi:hypothetical protein
MRRRSFAKSGFRPVTKPLCALAGTEPDGAISPFRIEPTWFLSRYEQARNFLTGCSLAPRRTLMSGRGRGDTRVFRKLRLAGAISFESCVFGTAH